MKKGDVVLVDAKWKTYGIVLDTDEPYPFTSRLWKGPNHTALYRTEYIRVLIKAEELSLEDRRKYVQIMNRMR